MNKKIDFFLGGHYICSSTQYRNLKDAVEGFKKNPQWAGLKADGTIGLRKTSLFCYDTVSVWWSDRQ